MSEPRLKKISWYESWLRRSDYHLVPRSREGKSVGGCDEAEVSVNASEDIFGHDGRDAAEASGRLSNRTCRKEGEH